MERTKQMVWNETRLAGLKYVEMSSDGKSTMAEVQAQEKVWFELLAEFKSMIAVAVAA